MQFEREELKQMPIAHGEDLESTVRAGFVPGAPPTGSAGSATAATGIVSGAAPARATTPATPTVPIAIRPFTTHFIGIYRSVPQAFRCLWHSLTHWPRYSPIGDRTWKPKN